LSMAKTQFTANLGLTKYLAAIPKFCGVASLIFQNKNALRPLHKPLKTIY
jgi:hypothetical protein